MDLVVIINALIVRELSVFGREIEAFPSDAAVWGTLPGVTNSAGNLAQHICGNLHHFVGAVLGGTGFVRQRDAEFAARERTRAQLAADLASTSEMVTQVFSGKTLADFPEVYPADFAGSRMPTALFLVHLEAHLAFHLGQAGYLRRAFTGNATSTGPIAVSALAAFAVKQG